MVGNSAKAVMASTQRYILAGVLAVIPLWITGLIFKFLLAILAQVGDPAVTWFSEGRGASVPVLSTWLIHPWFQSILAVVLVLVVLYAIGVIATQVIGRRLMRAFDALMAQIPLVKTIYGSVKMLLTVLQHKPNGVQRVVLIEFPSPDMKTVGFVTRTFVDAETGRELAAVYVPTTPNPTSGHLEIVPLEKITSTNWTMDEALRFIISGGAMAPATLHYEQSAETVPAPPSN